VNEHQEQMIERLVEWIEARGLRAPAILLLEANKPLAAIGGQALLFLQPLIGLVSRPSGTAQADASSADAASPADWAALLEHPAGIDRILERLERQGPLQK
jgi:hypothetical protein